MSAIRFERVNKSFGSREILKEVSFAVEPGEILFILGRSGMGKSVTLRHIVGLLKPDSGRVWVGDVDVASLSADELALARKKCGMVFQQPALFDSMSVFENIAFGLPGLPDDPWIRGRVGETLKLVHLSESIFDRLPPELSYGMQKRVSLARTLAPGPEILLFDEPTTGLDPITTRAVNDLIRELSRELQVTSLVVSHDMGCALAIADRILVIDEGRILFLGTPEDARTSAIPLIQDFLSETLALERVGT